MARVVNRAMHYVWNCICAARLKTRASLGDNRACYVFLTIKEFTNSKLAESIDLEFVRIAYDFEKAAKAVADSPLPNGYAEMLRKGY